MAVEIDGDYWHCNSTLYAKSENDNQKRVISKDKREKTYLVNRGWKLIRIWELNNDIDACVEKIQEAICDC